LSSYRSIVKNEEIISKDGDENKMLLQVTSECFNKVQCDFIYPAPDWIINSHTDFPSQVFLETAEFHHTFTRPKFIDEIDPEMNLWIYNILEYKSENELKLTMFRNDLFTL
jgi:hypothetical protein